MAEILTKSQLTELTGKARTEDQRKALTANIYSQREGIKRKSL